MVRFRVDDEIIAREFTLDDAESVFAVIKRNYDHLRRFMHWMVPDYSLDSAKDFISQAIAGRADNKSLSLALFRHGSFIGSIGFVNFDWLALKGEIGYWISKDEEGKGIMTRAAIKLIDHAFGEIELNRIEIRCSALNTRSSAIPERLGFKKEGVLRQAEFRDGLLHDFNLYGLLRTGMEDGEVVSKI